LLAPLPLPLCHIHTFITSGGIGLTGSLTRNVADIQPSTVPTLVYDITTEKTYRLPWTFPIWWGRAHDGSLIQLDNGTLVIIRCRPNLQIIGFVLNQMAPFATWQPMTRLVSWPREAPALVINVNHADRLCGPY
jgi:hypothetical protein